MPEVTLSQSDIDRIVTAVISKLPAVILSQPDIDKIAAKVVEMLRQNDAVTESEKANLRAQINLERAEHEVTRAEFINARMERNKATAKLEAITKVANPPK